jgi:oxygen-independent coproporphyrinogen-3 oxidase
LKEWTLYCKILGEKPTIKEIHLGGGTPFFLQNLEDLINGILFMLKKAKDHEFSFEGHPNTTYEHLQKLYDLGFRRVSFGVQDYSEKVQKQFIVFFHV